MTTQTKSPKKSKNLYKQLLDEALGRTLKPWRHPSFVFFFAIAVFGFSALGIWIELFNYIYPDRAVWPANRSDPLRTAILTFFPAVAGTAAMQLIWAEAPKHFRSAAFSLLVLFLAVALLISPSRISNASAISYGTLASIISVWVWWIANANQADLLDTVDPDDSVGGNDPKIDLHGSLAEFEH